MKRLALLLAVRAVRAGPSPTARIRENGLLRDNCALCTVIPVVVDTERYHVISGTPSTLRRRCHLRNTRQLLTLISDATHGVPTTSCTACAGSIRPTVAAMEAPGHVLDAPAMGRNAGERSRVAARHDRRGGGAHTPRRASDSAAVCPNCITINLQS